MNQNTIFISRICACLSLIFFTGNYIIAQESQPTADTLRKNAINLYIDCYSCDMDYIKEEIPYVNYMRDVKQAELYMLVTQQSTGSGGSNYTLFYDGSGRFEGMKDTLKFDSSPDDTRDIVRTGLTNTMALGLMRYVAKTPVANSIQLNYLGEVEHAPEQVEDKWDFWVFTLETRPRLEIEESVETYNWSNQIRINRITEDWKIELSLNHSYFKGIYTRTYYDYDLEEIVDFTTEAFRKSLTNDNLVVKSITDHWSTGLRTNFTYSTRDNYDLRLAFYPSLEYNLFRYSESNQRQLRFLYGIGPVYQDYNEMTTYFKTIDRLVQQTLDIAFEVQQQWGSANISLGYANYMHDFSKYHIELDGFISIRIFKGFSVNFNGGTAIIHDLINVPLGDVSEEDLYLNLRTLETNFSYNASIGIEYTFGSIYNNVVNPRFGSRRRGFGGGGGPR